MNNWNPADNDTRTLGAEVLDGKVFITVNGVTVGIVELDYQMIGSNSHDHVSMVARGVEYRVKGEERTIRPARLTGSVASSSNKELIEVLTVSDVHGIQDTANIGRNGFYSRDGESIHLGWEPQVENEEEA